MVTDLIGDGNITNNIFLYMYLFFFYFWKSGEGAQIVSCALYPALYPRISAFNANNRTVSATNNPVNNPINDTGFVTLEHAI